MGELKFMKNITSCVKQLNSPLCALPVLRSCFIKKCFLKISAIIILVVAVASCSVIAMQADRTSMTINDQLTGPFVQRLFDFLWAKPDPRVPASYLKAGRAISPLARTSKAWRERALWYTEHCIINHLVKFDTAHQVLRLAPDDENDFVAACCANKICSKVTSVPKFCAQQKELLIKYFESKSIKELKSSASRNFSVPTLLKRVAERFDDYIHREGGKTHFFKAFRDECDGKDRGSVDSSIFHAIMEGEDVNALDDKIGGSVLHHAAGSNSCSMLKTMLAAGACIDLKSLAHSLTPLHVAIGKSAIEAVKLLCACGANANECVQPQGNNSYPLIIFTTLLYQQKQISPAHACQIISCLAKAKGDVNARLAGRTALGYLILSSINEATTLEDIAQSLIKEIPGPSLELIRVLLENGADPNYCGPHDDDKSLKFEQLRLFKNPEIYKIIQKVHPEWSPLQKSNLVVQSSSQELGSQLHIYSESGNVPGVLDQLSAGVPVDIKGGFDYTPLHLAAYKNHKEIVKILLAAGADVNMCNINGKTPLYEACIAGHEEIVNILLAAGAGPNTPNVLGDAPLHAACNVGNEKIALMLLSAGANHNVKNNNGYTPLDIACIHGMNSSKLQHLLVVWPSFMRYLNSSWTACATALHDRCGGASPMRSLSPLILKRICLLSRGFYAAQEIDQCIAHNQPKV